MENEIRVGRTPGRRETEGEPLLVVEDLRTQFAVAAGAVQAVDGVSFALYRGRTLGVVGESGSGKTVLSRSIMGLNTSANATTTGSVMYAGDEMIGKSAKEKKVLWGAEMAMVFQDPMTSLNPVVTIGRQLTEHVRYHLDMGRKEANEVAIALLESVRHPRGREAARQLPAPDVGRHAPAGLHRDRPGLRPSHALRRRTHHGARRDGAAPDPQPARRTAARPRHGDDPRDPRPRRRGRTHRRDHGDVRRAAGGEGPDRRPVRQPPAPVHPGAALVDPEDHPGQAHPPRRHPRTTAEPHRPAPGLQVRATLRLRAGSVPHRGTRAAFDRLARPHLRLPFPGRHAGGRRRLRGEHRRGESSGTLAAIGKVRATEELAV